MTGPPPWARLVRAPNPGPMTLEGTNTWVLSARDGVVVVDPGPLDEGHLARVAACGPVLLTVLTHGHADHSEGARRFAALTGSPVLARDPALCVDALPAAVVAGDPGEERGVPGLSLRVLAAPGHTADSVVLLAESQGEAAALTGDTVLGRGTAVVAHPDGHLGDYIATLERLARLGAAVAPLTVLPGHGPVLPDLAAVSQAYVAHRRERLAQVRAALDGGAKGPEQVVDAVYPGLEPALRPAALRTARAALEHIRVTAAGGGLSASGG